MNHEKLTFLIPEKVDKKWGSELIICNNDEYCGKFLNFKKGAKFSMHAHVNKMETFFCLKGKVCVTGIDTENAGRYVRILREGDILHVPRFAFHQIEALEESTIIEFSTHHEDSDSYRVEAGDNQK
jgi:quercetin dioxygenase-like cupin family protein